MMKNIPRMYGWFYRSLILTISCILCSNNCYSLNVDYQTDQFNSFWSELSTRLDDAPLDSLARAIDDYVTQTCAEDDNCRFSTYNSFSFKCEKQFKLALAIHMCNKMLSIGEKMSSKEHEALAHLNLCRFHSALGEGRTAAFHSKTVYEIYTSLGLKNEAMRAKWFMLESSFSTEADTDYLDEMYAILQQTKDEEYIHGNTYFLRRYLRILVLIQKHEEALEFIDYLEEFSPSEELPEEARMSEIIFNKLTAAEAKGMIAEQQNRLLEAKKWFVRTSEYARQLKNPWRETQALIDRADIQIQLLEFDSAAIDLKAAAEIAERSNMNELLSEIYTLQIEVAEKNGDKNTAIAYYKKLLRNNQKWNELNSNLNAQKYFLEEEKNQLSAQNQLTDLEISLKNKQLTWSLIGVLIILILSCLILISWFKQKKRGERLALQNEIIFRQKEDLKSLDIAKTRFFSNVSHELRTPLTLIKGPVARLINQGQLNDSQEKLLHLVKTNTQLLDETVHDILDLQKLASKDMSLQLQPIAITPFFENITNQFNSLAEQQSVSLNYFSSVEEGLVVLIDPAKCKRILHNLLNNSFKFTENNDTVDVRIDLIQGILSLEVRDSGSGIHPDDLPHIFERFFQTKVNSSPAEGGTGIGLALCSEYAQLFGGTIKAESVKNEFTKIKATWPADMSQEAPVNHNYFVAHQEKDLSPQTASPETRYLPNLLVVEDNTDLQAFIKIILSEHYNITLANNGKDALEKLSSSPLPDLIVSDVMMPLMDGYQLLNALKEDEKTKHIPVIMITAKAEIKDKLKALRFGVDDYLIKPFQEEELLVRIQNLLENKSRRVKAIAEFEEFTENQVLSPDQEWLQKFEVYVNSQLADPSLNVLDLAQNFAMSESTLLRQVKRLTGLTTSGYLKDTRLEYARKELERGEKKTISAISYTAGFNDSRSFSRSFKKKYGILPSEIRRTTF